MSAKRCRAPRIKVTPEEQAIACRRIVDDLVRLRVSPREMAELCGGELIPELRKRGLLANFDAGGQKPREGTDS